MTTSESTAIVEIHRGRPAHSSSTSRPSRVNRTPLWITWASTGARPATQIVMKYAPGDR